jgi:hypothetical protein
MSIKQSLLSAISILFLPTLLIAQQPVAPVPPPKEVGSATNEFRAAWIATVTNIDWPTKGTTDPAKQ